MPYYNCTFLDDDGRYIKKTLFADNKKEVWKSYLGSDEKLLYIKRNLWKEEFSIKLFAKKLGYFDFLLFNQKMITLLRSGVSFVRGLEIVINNLKRGNLKEVLIQNPNRYPKRHSNFRCLFLETDSLPGDIPGITAGWRKKREPGIHTGTI